jgi:hypothetical protein
MADQPNCQVFVPYFWMYHVSWICDGSLSQRMNTDMGRAKRLIPLKRVIVLINNYSI